MKKTTIISICMAIAMAFAMSTTAEAQFGGLGNKLKDKAKRAVNNEVNKAEYEAKEKAKEKAKEAVGGTTQEGDGAIQAGAVKSSGDVLKIGDVKVPNPDKKYTPSEEAKAKDPKATSTELRMLSKKTIGEIHAAYEHLDPKYFPLQPYYDFTYFYNMDDNTEPAEQYWQAMGWLASGTNMYPSILPHIPLADFPGVNKDNPMAKYCIPAEDVFCYKWVTSYICDPANPSTFIRFTTTMPFYNCKLFKYKYKYVYEDEQAGIVNSEKGLTEAPGWRDMAYDRYSTALSLVLKYIPTERVVGRFSATLDVASNTSESTVNRVYNFAIAECMYTYLLENHPESAKFKDDQKYRLAVAKYNKLAETINKLVEQAAVETRPVADMPNSVTVDATTRSKAEAVAKTIEGYVDIVFTTNHWKPFKSSKWPYEVTHHAMPVYVITKSGDKYYIQQWDLQKYPSGKYNIIAGMGDGRQPVNYKK